MPDADLIVRGRILTLEARRPTAKAIAIGGGRILAVGTEAQADRWRGKRTKVWALRDRQTVVPGFIDSHTHLGSEAWRRTWVDLTGCATLEAALARIRARVGKARHGEWIVARGWDESEWPVKRYLSRHDLDRLSVSHPIVAFRVDVHMCAANSAALRTVGLTASDEGVEPGADGAPTGVLKEAAADRMRRSIPRPSDAEWADLLADTIAFAHSLGITCAHDCVDAHHARAYEDLRRQDRLTMRAVLMPYDGLLDSYVRRGLRTGSGDAWLRVGAMKAFADGSLGARSAALYDPYEDDPRATGALVHSPRDLTALLGKAHAAGFQVAVHAIGDRAIDVVVAALERVLDRETREDHRHRVEHCELPTGEALGRMRGLGIVPCMQPNFVARWSQPGGLYERRLGRERASRNNPFREVLRRRLPLAFGSDGMPYGPLYGMTGAVDAPLKAQRIAATDALRCYTANGARAGFLEKDLGTLAVGKLADFVVLPGDPWVAAFSELAVEATVVGGRTVHRRQGRRIRKSGRTVY